MEIKIYGCSANVQWTFCVISAKIFVYILTGDKFNMSVKSSKEENYFMRTKSRILYLLLSICLAVIRSQPMMVTYTIYVPFQ